MQDAAEPLMFRYEVPVDDRWHDVELSAGPVRHVAARSPDVVEFWAEFWPTVPTTIRRFRVYGTGHPIGGWRGCAYLGTAVVPGVALVWHLYEQVMSVR